MVPMEALVRLAVLSLLAVLLAGCGGSEDEAATTTAAPTTTAELREGRIFVQDTFSDPSSGWDSGVFEDGELGYVDGTYRIFVKNEARTLGATPSSRGDSMPCVWRSRPPSSPARVETSSGPAATPMSVRTWATSWESHPPSEAM